MSTGPFSLPEELIHRVLTPRVALHTPTGWDFDWINNELAQRLRVESVSAGLNERFNRAAISIDAGSRYVGGVEVRPALKTAELINQIASDTEIAIYVETPVELDAEGGPVTRRYLFHGYAGIDRLRLGERTESLEIGCTSKLEWAGRQKSSWVRGRYFYDPARAAAAEDPVVHVGALPCIFNRDNKPNRYDDLQELFDEADTPVFTNDGEGVYWTFADVLYYLLIAYATRLGDEARIDFDQIKNITAEIVAANAGPQNLIDPTGATIDQVLKAKAEPMSFEGLDLVRALLLWCRMTHSAVQQWTFADDAGEPVTRVLLHHHGDGGPYTDYGDDATERTVREDIDDTPVGARPLQLQEAGASAADGDPQEFHAANEVAKAEIVRDGVNCVTSCEVVGQPNLWEVVIGKRAASKFRNVLLPGWEPDTMFGDNLSGDAVDDKIAEIAQAINGDAPGNAGTMFERYNAQGKDHWQYRLPGRLWLLNEDMALDGATYGRMNDGYGLWADWVYDLVFSFHDICGVPKSVVVAGEEGVAWAARRRPILDLVTRGPGGVTVRPIVVCSFNAGDDWYPYPGNVRFLDDRFGLLLTDPNLGTIINKANSADDWAAGDSVWKAIVCGTFLIAVKCSVEGDAVVIGESDPAAALTAEAHHQDLHVHDGLRYESSTGANSDVHQMTGYAAADLDESAEAINLANRVISGGQERRHSANVIIPRLTDKWRPGDLVSGIEPRAVPFATTTYINRAPEVVKIVWLTSEENQATHVMIGDSRTQVREA